MNRSISDRMWEWAKFQMENYGWPQAAVARAMYVHKSTLGREIKARGGIHVPDLKAPVEIFMEDDVCGPEEKELLDDPEGNSWNVRREGPTER